MSRFVGMMTTHKRNTIADLLEPKILECITKGRTMTFGKTGSINVGAAYHEICASHEQGIVVHLHYKGSKFNYTTKRYKKEEDWDFEALAGIAAREFADLIITAAKGEIKTAKGKILGEVLSDKIVDGFKTRMYKAASDEATLKKILKGLDD